MCEGYPAERFQVAAVAPKQVTAAAAGVDR
jgi:hypothetical protein